ncbi:MAG: VPDSG-CTERM sorting domain-containing protein [Chthoniobacterales bacterium]
MGLAGAQAAPITGLLNISGTGTFDTTSLGTATSVVSFTNVTVGGGNTGSFASIPVGTSVTMAAPYIFSPSTGTPALWSVDGFFFDLQTSTITMQNNNNFLSITGTGTIFGPDGLDPTPGVWAFTSQNASGLPGSTFTFSANTAAVGVPDGGMTVALLGAGLLGMAAFRAKFGKP